jgi:hypothetical protein
MEPLTLADFTGASSAAAKHGFESQGGTAIRWNREHTTRRIGGKHSVEVRRAEGQVLERQIDEIKKRNPKLTVAAAVRVYLADIDPNWLIGPDKERLHKVERVARL